MILFEWLTDRAGEGVVLTVTNTGGGFRNPGSPLQARVSAILHVELPELPR